MLLSNMLVFHLIFIIIILHLNILQFYHLIIKFHLIINHMFIIFIIIYLLLYLQFNQYIQHMDHQENDILFQVSILNQFF